MTRSIQDNGTAWGQSFHIYGVGIQCVRRMQRWWRRMGARRYKERAVAVMMGGHARLGADSPLMALDESVLRMCVGW
jgi:hypothetical protein